MLTKDNLFNFLSASLSRIIYDHLSTNHKYIYKILIIYFCMIWTMCACLVTQSTFTWIRLDDIKHTCFKFKSLLRIQSFCIPILKCPPPSQKQILLLSFTNLLLMCSSWHRLTFISLQSCPSEESKLFWKFQNIYLCTLLKHLHSH